MYKKEHFKKEKIHNEKQLTNYRKSELRVDIVNKELAIFTATVDAIVIGAHGQAVDLTIFVFLFISVGSGVQFSSAVLVVDHNSTRPSWPPEMNKELSSENSTILAPSSR